MKGVECRRLTLDKFRDSGLLVPNGNSVLGILGVGNMGESILRAIVGKGIIDPSEITIYDVVEEKTRRLSEELGVRVSASIRDLAGESSVLLYSAKPQNIGESMPEVARSLVPPRFLISIAAGVKTSKIESFFDWDVPVVRVMPNIAALVGEAASAICGGKNATNEHLLFARMIFDATGKAIETQEKLMDVVTGLSGSGPAFVFLMIEAMIDAGVQLGLSRPEAETLTVQTFLGASKMLAETGEHPAVLKAKVTSPGGTTAAGLFEMESTGVRSAIARAVIAATKRSMELGE